MEKKLEEMSLEELWRLFPIRLEAHSDRWAESYREQEQQLREILPEALRISHIGSTAVPGIWAKPIVDILAEIPLGVDMETAAEALKKSGWRLMSKSAGRLSFNKGYTEAGFAEKVYHLHLRCSGDNAELYFRDYLIAHPETAAEYEKLKLSLWHRFEHDRDGYTEAKTEFVRSVTEKAKADFADRYA